MISSNNGLPLTDDKMDPVSLVEMFADNLPKPTFMSSGFVLFSLWRQWPAEKIKSKIKTKMTTNKVFFMHSNTKEKFVKRRVKMVILSNNPYRP